MRIPRMTLRRPRGAGRGLRGRRAGAAGARRAVRARAAREPDGRAGRLHRAARPAGDRHLARRDGDVHRLPRLGRIDGPRRADTARVTIAGDEVTADLTESSPMVRGSLNSTRSFVMACVYQAVRCALTSRCRTRGAFRPVTRPDEAGHRGRGRDARRFVDAWRDRVPGPRRAQRRARAAHPGPGPGRGRGRQHARDLRRRRPERRRPVRLLRARRRHLGRHAASATATTGSRTPRASPRTSRSRWPSRSSRSSSNATGSCPTRAGREYRGGLAIERSLALPDARAPR